MTTSATHPSPDHDRHAEDHHLIAHYQFWAGLSRSTSRALAARGLMLPAVEAAGAATRFAERANRVSARAGARAARRACRPGQPASTRDGQS